MDAGAPRQVVLGILAALISLAVVIGGFMQAFTEGKLGQAYLLKTRFAPTATQVSDLIQMVTLEPGQELVDRATPLSTETTSAPTETPVCAPPSDWIQLVSLPGDTLQSLAFDYGINVDELKKNNCLTTDSLIPGLLVNVPNSPVVTNTSKPPTRTPQPSATQEVCGPPSSWVPYTVKPKDTLYNLARLAGIGVWDAARANCLRSPDDIKVGQILYFPVLPRTETPTATLIKTTPTKTLSIPTSAVKTSTPTVTKTTTLTSTYTITVTQTPTVTFTQTITQTPTVTLTPTSSPGP